VAETAVSRVQRVWLTGARAGRSEVLIDHLGGYPDNIALGSDGLVWIALAARRRAIVTRVQAAPTAVRSLVRRIPDRLQPQPSRDVGVMAVDAMGRIVHEAWGEIAGFSMLTGVREVDGTLWFGSLRGDAVAVLRR
jgi:hypothetical protein